MHQQASTPVAIVGAGPVGLALALGLARHGVRSTLLERGPGTSEHSKAPAVHVRTREVLRAWGAEDALLNEGTLLRHVRLHSARSARVLLDVDLTALAPEARDPGLLVLRQSRTEALLLEAVRATGQCDVRFGCEAVALERTGEDVTLTLVEDGRRWTVTARYVVGCDGAHSFVRGALGMSFDGLTYPVAPMLADVRVDAERDRLGSPRLWMGRGGMTAAVRLEPRLWRLIRIERSRPRDGEVSDAELSARVREALGPGPTERVWASRFRIHRRSARRMRVGRVLLAGDSAHVHSPAGGQGMNAGVQDAHNLAWKLAACLSGGDEDLLLASYEAERRAVVVGSVSRFTGALTRVVLAAPTVARYGALSAGRLVMRVPGLRRRALRRAAMLDLGYPPGPLIGRTRGAGTRLPDVLLAGSDGRRVRVLDLLGHGSAVLALGDVALPPGLEAVVDRVVRVGAHGFAEPTGALRRLVGGTAGWVVVRPDGHVAWTGRADGGEADLAGAVRAALGRRPEH